MWLNRILRTFALFALYFYQAFLRGFFGGTCRFEPSCSEYAVQAFREQPPHKAAYLVTRRLCRCHPLGSSGWDPVPANFKENTSV